MKNKTDNLKDNKHEQINKLNLTANEKYHYVIEARNFHYREFNVWSTYFSVIVGALFVAYYNLLNDHPLLAFVVSALGFIASLCWYLSAKGYAYWWYHWSEYLIYLENHDINKIGSCGVYSTFFDPKSRCRKGNKKAEFDNGSKWNPLEGSNVSTSKVILFLTFCITVAWAIVCIWSASHTFDRLYRIAHVLIEWISENVWYAIVVLGIIIVTFLLLFKIFRSDISNHVGPK